MGERHWHGWTEGLRYHRSRHHRGHGSRSMWGWPGHSMGSGPRARRGDIRTGVLALLAESPMHGYQIIQELEARSGGVWRPSPGSVYPTLQLLADEGLVSGEEENGKRVYSLTEAGHALVEKEGVRENAPWADVAEGAEKGLMDLKNAFFQLGAAGMQVAQTGSADDVKRTIDVLTEARRQVYALLAEGE
jgi:DNA-binding PadR family transcriptional regulator